MGDFIQKIEVSDPIANASGLQSSVERYLLTGINVLVVGAGVVAISAVLNCSARVCTGLGAVMVDGFEVVV
jgi:hypothetical protein